MKGKRKSFLAKVLAAFMAVMIFSPSAAAVSSNAAASKASVWSESNEENTEEKAEDDISYSAAGNEIYFPADGEESPYTGRNTVDHIYGYYSLSNREQKIYDSIVSAMQDRKSSIAFRYKDKVKLEELAMAWYVLILNDYSFFYVKIESPDYTTYRNTDYIATVHLHYEYDAAQIKEMRKELEAEADKILSQLTPEMSDYEIVKLIHDSIIPLCTYSDEVDDKRTAYGCLVNGEANCQGYSRTFIYLCSMAGIKALSVHNDTHMWNLVEIDGEYYHIDLVGDDQDWEDYPDFALYSYFCLTDEEIAQLRDIEDDGFIELPAADGTKYYYYSYNDLIASDADEASEIITRETVRAVEDGESGIQFVCTDSESCREIYSKLCANNAKSIFSAMKKAAKQSDDVTSIESIKMSVSEELLTIVILFNYAD